MSEPTRNAPCPCGSGKRYKHCHGAPGAAAIAASATVPAPLDRLFAQAQELHQAGGLAGAESLYRQILATDPHHAQALHYLGVIHFQRGELDAAAARIEAALAANPAISMAANNLALILRARGRLAEALAWSDKAVMQEPANPVAHNNRGLMLCDLQRFDESLASCDRAIALKPDFPEALANRGKVLYAMGRHAEAAASCRKAVELAPGLPNVMGHWVHSAMHLCDWDGIEEAWARLRAALARNEPVALPFGIMSIPASQAEQQHCARLCVRTQYPAAPVALRPAEPYRHGRIRIGYVSSDFRNHATSHLLAEVLERHDRSRYEIVAFSLAAVPDDPWQRRIRQAVDRFEDVGALPSAAIAERIRALEIDVVVDLNGHTGGSRPDIFAWRAAPLQVNYMGYPGTFGADYIDYIIADHVVIPPGNEAYFDEKVVRLPHFYLPNDTTKQPARPGPTRAECGLPEAAFVWCCFNGNVKITPDVFDIWMRLLKEIGGSVLWLLGSDVPRLQDNLRREALRRGVDPARLVFAPRISLADHLARHRHADLFLDTFYYNAHTTTIDALSMALPVLTCIGETFPSRVAASALGTIGLPELIAGSHADYEALALALARDPARLQALRDRLRERRTTTPLFDTAAYTRHLEHAFAAMIERLRQGLPPASFAVPDVDTPGAASARDDGG